MHATASRETAVLFATLTLCRSLLGHALASVFSQDLRGGQHLLDTGTENHSRPGYGRAFSYTWTVCNLCTPCSEYALGDSQGWNAWLQWAYRNFIWLTRPRRPRRPPFLATRLLRCSGLGGGTHTMITPPSSGVHGSAFSSYCIYCLCCYSGYSSASVYSATVSNIRTVIYLALTGYYVNVRTHSSLIY